MKKYFIYICLMAGVFTSCGDFLDRQPKTQVDAEFMFETEQGFKDALMDCYVKMGSQSIYGEHMTMTTIELMAQHWELSTANHSTENELKNLDYTSEDYTSIINNMYAELYGIIVQANDVIAHLDETGSVIDDADTRAIIEGEALAIRAFAHFDILRLFGQMPTGGTKEVSLAYAEIVGIEEIPAISYDAFVAKLISDLDNAEELMTGIDPVLAGADEDDPDSFLQYREFRINVMAVKALKARVYLYLGEKTLANQYANEVINATKNDGEAYMTLSGQDDVKNYYYTMPSETIFRISKRDIADYANTYMATSYYRLSYSTFVDVFDIYTTNDIRANYVWNPNTSDETTAMAIIRKFRQPDIDEDSTEAVEYTQVIPIIRLAEMYLIAIETSEDIEEANSLYSNYLLTRNIVAPLEITATNKYEILKDEYRRELYAEGQMFFFYKRNFAPTMDYGYRSSELSETEYILPLPSSEVSYTL